MSLFTSPTAFVPSAPLIQPSSFHRPLTSRRITTPICPPSRYTPTAAVASPSNVAGGGMAPAADQFLQYDGCDFQSFANLASQKQVRMVPLWTKLFSDQLTPVIAYRCLVPDTDLTTPSFLLESVYTPERAGRYSIIGARPVRQVVAYGQTVTISSSEPDLPSERTVHADDPWDLIRTMSEELAPADPGNLPGGTELFSGGWVGYGGYDTMRYAELSSLPFSDAPNDDRGLPDLHLGLYRDVVVIDHVGKVVYVMHWVDLLQNNASSNQTALKAAHDKAISHLDAQVDVLSRASVLTPLKAGRVQINVGAAASQPTYPSNMSKETFMEALATIHEHILAGDTFQTVFSQRFERWSTASPFCVYRALRIINPSPYMIYMQCKDCVLVASSPEILTKVVDGVLTNRPLAGTRRRGTTNEEDAELAKDLLQDEKDRSEHMMLVDLGRNDVGKVSEYGSVNPERIMDVERYSHVMHISSTITGKLREGMTSWDALRSTLPAGTISGAPKIRAMQIIDSLEPTKRGPYGGGIGFVSFHDTMNMALALRTMVVPTKPRVDDQGRKEWCYYLQAGAGIVFESDPEAEYTETVNKAMALNRAIDLAENAFNKSEGTQS